MKSGKSGKLISVYYACGERIPKLFTLSIKAEEQRSTSERKSSPSSEHFQVALQHAIWGNNVNRPGETRNLSSPNNLWATTSRPWDGFWLFQSCTVDSLTLKSLVSIGGSIVDNNGMDLVSSPLPRDVAFRRSEMPSGQILWHSEVACHQNHQTGYRFEGKSWQLDVGHNGHEGHVMLATPHTNQQTLEYENGRAMKGPKRQFSEVGCTTPSVRFCSIFLCQTESKGFVRICPLVQVFSRFLTSFQTDLALWRTPGP